MDSPVGIVLEMIAYLLGSGIDGLAEVVKFLGKLVYSLFSVSGSGLSALLISTAILGIAVLLAWKFVIGSLKFILILMAIGVFIIIGVSLLMG